MPRHCENSVYKTDSVAKKIKTFYRNSFPAKYVYSCREYKKLSEFYIKHAFI